MQFTTKATASMFLAHLTKRIGICNIRLHKQRANNFSMLFWGFYRKFGPFPTSNVSRVKHACKKVLTRCGHFLTCLLSHVRHINIYIRHFTTGIRSEKCVVRQFRRCANVYLHKPRQNSLLHT